MKLKKLIKISEHPQRWVGVLTDNRVLFAHNIGFRLTIEFNRNNPDEIGDDKEIIYKEQQSDSLTNEELMKILEKSGVDCG